MVGSLLSKMIPVDNLQQDYDQQQNDHQSRIQVEIVIAKSFKFPPLRVYKYPIANRHNFETWSHISLTPLE